MFLVFQRAMVTLRISAAHGNDLRWRTLALWRIRGVSVLICVCASTRETQEMSGCLRSKLIQRYTKKKETTLQKYFVKQSLYKPDIEVALLTMMKSCWCRCTLCVRSGIVMVELCTKIWNNYELIFLFRLCRPNSNAKSWGVKPNQYLYLPRCLSQRRKLTTKETSGNWSIGSHAHDSSNSL